MAAPLTATPAITKESIQQAIAAVAGQPELDEEIKNRVTTLYNTSVDHLEKRQQLLREAEQSREAIASVVEAAKKIDRTLGEPDERLVPPVSSRPLLELEPLQVQVQAEVLRLQEERARLEGETMRRANRRKEAREAIAASPEKIEAITKQLAATPGDESPSLTTARRVELETRRQLLEAQPAALADELALYDAEEAADLLRKQRDLNAKQLEATEKRLERITMAIGAKRQAKASQAVRQAEREVEQTSPALRPLAEDNEVLANKTKELTALIAKQQSEIQKVNDLKERTTRQFQQTSKKVTDIGLTRAIGLTLRKQRSELPSIRQRRQNVSDRQMRIDDAQFLIYEYEEQRGDLSDLKQELKDFRKQLTSSKGEASGDSEAPLFNDNQSNDVLVEQAEELLKKKRDYLNSLIKSQNAYYSTLIELATAEESLIKVTEQYQSYIDERVLWIRSARPLWNDARLDPALMEFVSWENAKQIGVRAYQDVKEEPIIYVASLLLFFLMLRAGSHAKKEITQFGEQAEKGACAEIAPTLRTLVPTAIVAIPWPGLMMFVAWRLAVQAEPDTVAMALANGIWVAAFLALLLQVLRQICRTNGLAQSHFMWPRRVQQELRRTSRIFTIFLTPLALIVGTLHEGSRDLGQDTVERLAFIAACLVIAYVMWRWLSPRYGAIKEFVTGSDSRWLVQLRYVWTGVLVSLPLIVAGLSLMGYYYTAWQLSFRAFVTAWGLIAIVLLRSLLMRAILVQRRRLSMAEARRRRQEQQEQAAAAENNEDTDGDQVLAAQQLIPQEELRPDFKEQSQQTGRIVQAVTVAAAVLGLWLIWGEVVPALGYFDKWELWSTTVAVSERVDDGGLATQVVRDELRWVTMSDVLTAIICLIVTIVAVRNAPGLLEISILQQLPLDNSVRYAITSLARYVIVLIGILVAANVLGLQWSQVQWLATALTFGLAFGLQEMFANFVAGIILLFERPIRVGDIVTIDDTTGVVSRIRIRATTVTNWDRKEFIVPNKEFITGKLWNWTLSDQTNRVVINVGVAYGSDTERAREILLKVCDDHPKVMKDPLTQVTFESFGDSTLNLTVRTYLPKLDDRLPTIHELHTNINNAFNEAGIEIAFPQRDLHVRGIPAGLERLLERGGRRAAGKGDGDLATANYDSP